MHPPPAPTGELRWRATNPALLDLLERNGDPPPMRQSNMIRDPEFVADADVPMRSNQRFFAENDVVAPGTVPSGGGGGGRCAIARAGALRDLAALGLPVALAVAALALRRR